MYIPTLICALYNSEEYDRACQIFYRHMISQIFLLSFLTNPLFAQLISPLQVSMILNKFLFFPIDSGHRPFPLSELWGMSNNDKDFEIGLFHIAIRQVT